jgi:hypothetical protein
MIKWIGQHIFDFIARFRQGEIWMGNSNVDSKIEAESNNGTGKDLTIKAGSLDGTVANSTGGNLYLKSGLGSGGSYGGDVFIYGGNRGSGGSTSVNSEMLLATFDSNEFLRLGNADGSVTSFGIQPHTRTTDQLGQHLYLYGGSAYGTNRNGGDIVLNPGAPTGSGNEGSIKILSTASSVAKSWTWHGTDATCSAFSDGTGPELILESGNTTATNCGQLTFRKDTQVAPYTEDDEYLGQISFYGDDSGNADTLFANILAQIKEVDNTDEAGKLTIQVATSDGSTSTLRNALYAEGSPSTDDVDVTIGHGTTSTTTIPGDASVTSELTTGSIRHSISGSNAGEYGPGAEILYNVGATSVTAGVVYVNRDGTWVTMDADNGEAFMTQLCAVATVAAGNGNSSNGMLIRGCVTLAGAYTAGTDNVGKPVYASATAGEATLTAPSSSGNFVRILGYSLNVGDKKMFFNPDSTWVEIA